MKRIKIGHFASLFACCLAFAQAPSFAQAEASSASAPAKQAEESPTQILMNKMENAIHEAKASKDTKGVNDVISEASKADIPDADLGSIVAMAVRAFPDSIAPFVQTAVVSSGGSKASSGRVLSVMQSAVSAHPRPFSVVVPVRDSVLQVVGDSPSLVSNVRTGAIAIAEYASDNPLATVAVPAEASSTHASSPSHIVVTDAGGTLLLPVDGVPVASPPLTPASPSDGAQ